MGFSGTIAQFWADKRANISMIFALTLLPIIAVAGFAIDSQIGFTKKEHVQQAADSAALAAARMMQKTSDKDDIRGFAQSYFDAMSRSGSGGLTCDGLQVQLPSKDEIRVSANCSQATILTQIIGNKKLDFQVASTVVFGVSKLDVAFVFDISGSMNSHGRLADLKVAAKDAADTLLPEPGSSSSGDVRIAMVAYNSMIDAGEFFEEVTGLKKVRKYVHTEMETVEETYTDREEECGYPCISSFWGICLRYGPYQCEWKNVEKTRWVEKPVDKEYTMNSTCVYERNGDEAFTDKQPKQLQSGALVNRLPEGSYNASTDPDNPEGYLTSAYAYWHPGSRYESAGFRTVGTDCSDVAPFELSNNATQIEKYIDRLKAGGGTAGHQGIAWGWYMISDKWGNVFDYSAKPLEHDRAGVVKSIIIMTDGEFNSEFHNSQGNSFAQSKKICDAIKDDNVTVYTIAFDAPKAGKEIMEYCASGPEFAFEADNGAELLESYQQIATSISNLRIKF
ncbi:VWA domain-containing protein [Henriciella litoralis]|uniref:VWA domain-containing protein n=1 Tax=Henriciella litoralis TaxID=568102 RepID=UPI000A03F071|nr:VWA domain-containing protein [Henriciella litoralis]